MATQEQGLFGISPQQLMQGRQEADYARNLAAVQLTPMQQSNLMLRQAGSQIGQLGSSLLGIEDPQMQAAKEAQALAGQFDLTSSAGLKDLTLALQQRAQQTGNQALAGLIPQAAAAYQKAALNEATIADKLEKTVAKTPNTGEIVNQQLFAKFRQDAINQGVPADQVDLVAAQLYDKYETDKKVKVSAASATPAPGQVPLTTIKQAQDIVGEYTAKPLEKLDKIKVIAALGQGVKNNSTLMPSFQKELANFVRDSQISNADFNRAIGSSGIAADAIDSVNKFFTGAPTNAKIDDVLKGWKEIEKVYAEQYNTGLKKATTVLEQGKIAPETQKSILPPAYNIKPKVNAPAVGVVQNGYQFLGGNPADPKSWKAVK